MKNTKRALLSSILSLLLCCSMLIGTTFAWFTDEVVSKNNIITAGNLDVELEWSTDAKTWYPVNKDTNIFEKSTLWEPGKTEVVYFKVVNAGTLALKYNLGINVHSEVEGTNVKGETFKLSDYIQFGVKEVAKDFAYASRTDARAAVADISTKLNVAYARADKLLNQNDTHYLAMVVYMPEEVGNEANYMTGTNIPTINLGINLFATQQMAENDSFGPDYDKGAAWTGDVDTDWYFENPDAAEFVLTSAEELAGFAAIVNGTATAPVNTYAATEPTTVHDDFAGQTVKLAANVDLRDVAWTPIGRIGTTSTDFTYAFRGTFDGQNHTVYNLNVSNEGWAGLFGLAYQATINNVKVEGVAINSNRMAGSIVGQLYGSMNNCHASEVTIMVVPNAVGDSYDNGDKVGGIVGWIGDNNNNRILTNCSVTNAQIGAYRDVGGIAGYVAWSTTISNNQVTATSVTVDQTTNFYGEKDPNAGEIWGRNSVSNSGVGVIAENNTATYVTIDTTYIKDGLTLKAGTNGVTLYLVPADYAGDTVNVPEGVTTIGNYAFTYNSNVKTVILASTVRDLGRGFDSSTVEKVVLNEGLTTISSRAFRATTALKEVVISSTVTIIEDNAFQKSGIKEIVIPANVKTIGETAFGASLIEKVTFEGDIAIQGYAFRGCTKLHTVVMKGYDVTFVKSTLNGRNSMWFCNGESNNPNTSDIDFYVKNEVIKERVLTAMGAERNNTDVYCEETTATDENGDSLGYYVDEQGTTATTYDAKGVINALEDENVETVVLAGDVTVASSEVGSNAYGATGVNVLNGQTFDGNGNDFGVDAWGTWDSAISTTGGMIKNVTINQGMRGIFVNHNSTNSGKVYLENVIIDGTVYTISCDQGTNSGLEAINCTFNGWTSYAATIGNVEFTNCSFGEGQGYAFCRPYAPTTFVNCNFEAGFEIDPRAAVTFENCYLDGVLITAENLATLVTSNIANATVK